MRIERLTPMCPEWAAFCAANRHDFHHTAAYHRVAAAEEGGDAWLWVATDGARALAWPTLVQTHRTGLDHAGSVYGYAGPFGSGIDDPAFLVRAWRSLTKAWRAVGIATVFTRFHPILNHPDAFATLETPLEPVGGSLSQPGRSVAIDLSLDTEARRRRYQKVLRQEVRAAERAGLVVRADAEWRQLERFVELYRETMAANDAASRYRFDLDYFRRLRVALGDTARLAVVDADGEIAAAMLYTVAGHVAQAHLTGSDARFRRHSPLKLLIDGVADLARESGAGYLHLGAGRGGYEDSLFAFKSRFSPLRFPFALGRWIVDPARYRAVLAAHGIDRELERDFFPAYLAPGVASRRVDESPA